MKQSRLIGLLVAVSFLAAPLLATAEEALIVPDALDFDLVEVGDSVVLPLEVRSVDPDASLIVLNISIVDDPSASFEITYIEPPIPASMPPGTSILVEVTYSPTSVGEHLGTLRIESNDHLFPTINVPLSGEGYEPGGEEPTPQELMDELIEFFEAAVDADELNGVGHNAHARRARLQTIRLKLQLASLFLNWDRDRAICNMLLFVERRSDGEGHPADFVTGSALAEFNALVVGLREALECGSSGGCGH